MEDWACPFQVSGNQGFQCPWRQTQLSLQTVTVSDFRTTSHSGKSAPTSNEKMVPTPLFQSVQKGNGNIDDIPASHSPYRFIFAAFEGSLQGKKSPTFSCFKGFPHRRASTVCASAFMSVDLVKPGLAQSALKPINKAVAHKRTPSTNPWFFAFIPRHLHVFAINPEPEVRIELSGKDHY